MKPLDRRVLGHLRPARGALVAVVASGTTSGLLTIAQGFALAALVVRLVADPSRDDWHVLGLALAAIVAARAACSHVGDAAAARAAGQVSLRLRERVLDADARLPEGRRLSPAELTVLTTRGMAAVEPYVTRYLPALVPAAVLPLATIVAIWSQDWIAGLIVVLTLPLVPLFAALIGMATQDRAQKQWRAMETLSGHFLDVVTGLPTLVAHRRAGAQVRTIRTVTHRYRRATVDTLKIAFASSTVLELIATLSVALVAVAVGLRLASGSVEFQVALTVLLLAPEAYWPLRRVGAEFHAAAEGTAALAEADQLLDAAATVPAPGSAVPASTTISLRGLQVGYAGTTLVAPVDLTLPPTGLVAVTGPSGCGKSTLLATVRGTLAPVAGSVEVGGTPLVEVDPVWWRDQVAWAAQRPWLVAGTLGENVRLGRPGASDAEIHDALARVGLAEHVESLPLGLDTVLGEDGAGLSAGQRARVSLARVVLARRPVIVLDEPTAHLDAETERVLLETLTSLSEDSLIVTVAHRDAVVRAADLVVDLTPAVATAPHETTREVAVAVDTERASGVVHHADDSVEPTRWGLRTATLLGSLSVASGVALTATAGWLITRASEHPPVLHLMVAIVGVRMFGLARPALRHAERVISHDTVLRTLAERRAQVFAALVPLVPGRLGPRRGDLLTSVVDDVDAVLDDELRVRQPVVTGVVVGAGAVLLAAFLAPGAALVIGAVALAGPLAFWLARARARAAETELVRSRAELSELVEEYGTGLGELQQWHRTQQARGAISAVAARVAAAGSVTVRGTAAGRALTQLVAGLGVAAMALVAAGPVTGENLALLLLVPLALVDATSPMAEAGSLSVRTSRARARLEDLEQLSPAVSDVADPEPLTDDHSLRLRRVSAAWDEREALAPIDLDVAAGSRIGVVGASGSGKSTLAAVLVRHLDPTGGSYHIGTVPARRARLEDVRAQVLLVDDDPHVFASTLAENVRLAAPDADDARVAAALTRARLGAWVAGLPEGMHTFVGTGHRAVSGGERARIELARALLAEPAVLVLDEPTAHLDTATAREVSDDLLDAAARDSRSVVWITHTSVGLDRMEEVLEVCAPALSPARAPSVAGV